MWLANSTPTGFMRSTNAGNPVTKGKHHNCHVIMRILICEPTFTVSHRAPFSLAPAHMEIAANYNHVYLTCATVWFINHRLATRQSRIFSHGWSATVIFSAGIHTVIFMSKCGRVLHYRRPSGGRSAAPAITPSRIRGVDERREIRLMRSTNRSMGTRGNRLAATDNDCYLYQRIYAN